jgi:hypothetical protein
MTVVQGLYDKYDIVKKNGQTDPNAVYFVLRLDTDPHARIAALAYANSIKPSNLNLSMDIMLKLNELNAK